MTGPPPARSQPIRTLLPSLQKIVWFQSCRGENDTLYLPEPEPNRSRQVVCRSAEICHSGENKKSTEGCGFKPRWHGLYSQPHCFKYVFSWLNKEKKRAWLCSQSLQRCCSLASACEDSGEHAHFCRQTSMWTCQMVTPISPGGLSDVSRWHLKSF